MKTHISLDDILDLQLVQGIQNDFAVNLETDLIILDETGQALTEISPADGGSKGRTHTEENFWLTEAAAELLEKNRLELKPGWVSLKGDSVTAAVPILFEEQYFGSLVALWNNRNVENDQSLKCGPGREIESRLRCLAALNDSFMRMLHKNRHLQQTIRRLRANNKNLQAFVDAGETPMYVCDYETGDIEMVNQAFCKQIGLDSNMLIGEKCWKVNGNSEDGFCSFCPRYSIGGDVACSSGVHLLEYYNEKLGKWLKCMYKIVRRHGGKLGHMVTQVDVTQEHKLKDNLIKAAYFDRHTGLPNCEKLGLDLKEIKNNLETDGLHLICLGVKAVQQFNRIYGKKNGYKLFSSMSDWIHFLDNDLTVYRSEGYNLCILAPDRKLRQCISLAREIKTRFNEPWRITINGQVVSHYCTSSVAVICLDHDFICNDINDLIERTLRSAEKRKDILVYDGQTDLKEKSSVQFEVTLKNQVRNGMSGFAVHYQPIVDAQGGIWKGLEALCRWTNPTTGEVVPPSKFIPEAEKLGLIGVLGEWVLENSLRHCKSLKLDELDDFFLSVNISFLQIMDDGFTDRVADMLKRYDYPGHKLDLEVTESMEFHFNEYTMNIIDKLRTQGIRIALDDFGTGYSAFNHLKNLPAKFVKTEREFILDIERDVHMQYLYYVISELAHMNDMKLIAEGIENRSQLEMVKNNGADYIQGYYYSKPLSEDQLADCLVRFQQPDPALVTEESSPVNLEQWLNCSNAYAATPKLFQLLNQCIEILFAEQDLKTLLEKMLEILGRHFSVSRSFTCLGDFNGQPAIFEWCDRGLDSSLASRDRVIEGKIAHYLHKAFEQNGFLMSSDVSRLKPEFYDLLQADGVKSVLILPMPNEDQIVGYVGFHDLNYREWNSSEIVMLWNLARILGTSLEQIKLKKDAINKKRLLSNVLNTSGFNVMVCDIDSAEVLWANDTLQANYISAGNVLGRKCHELLHGLENRCQGCKVAELVEKGENGPICHKRFSQKLKRSFIIYEGLIQWDNGRPAHIEYFLDVTEVEQLRKEVEYYANIDTLTGALNRDKLIERLDGHLAGWDKQTDFTVVFLDVDNLKAVNLQYGYQTGDKYLCHMVTVLKKAFAQKDVVGRVDSDGFIILLPGYDRQMAEALIQSVLEDMREVRFASAPNLVMSFSHVILDLLDEQPGFSKAYDIMARAEDKLNQAVKSHLLC